MSHNIDLICHKCGRQWSRDIDREVTKRVIFRGKTRVEVYVFSCPSCGASVVAEIEREA
jgi:uncharacterized Zn finger protein